MLLGKRVVICVAGGIETMRLRHFLLQAGLYVIGSAAKGMDAIEVTLESKPDIVLLDSNLKDMDGLEAARHLMAHGRFCIVMIAEEAEEGREQKARQIGVSDYLVQPILRQQLLSRLEAAWEAFEESQKLSDREASRVEWAA
ncbi:MAG TPA: response regulator [Chthonomonadaceae bacterium]|nr:response regulator [Chthonomonadaceae bacterium]